MNDEFLEDENFIIVIPTTSKPVKIIFEDSCRLEATENPMEFTLTKKATLGEMAAGMGMRVEELIELMSESM